MTARSGERSGGNREPLVGIGMPVYNGAHFVGQALDSLLAQTLTDFIVVVSDNGSTDETSDICSAYAARDARIQYMRQPRNLGLPNNWNYVARAARGKYFKWASANDYVSNNMLEACVRELEAQPDAVLTFCRTVLVGAQGEQLTEYTENFPLPENEASERYRTLCQKMRLNNAISGVIRRKALLETGLIRPYPASDLVLMVELALRGKFHFLSEATFYRRTDPGSMSSHLTRAELLRLHDPRAGGGEWTNMRKHRDLIGVTVSAGGLTTAERLRSLSFALRQAAWAREEMLAELTASTRRFFSSKGPKRSS